MITQRFHYIFDAWGIKPGFLDDKKLVNSLLKETAEICKMRIICGPHTVQGMDYNPGISGFCIIDFSHISIHTFSNPSEVCVDIFSCKQFNPKEVRGYLLKKLAVSPKNLMFFKVDYPNRQKISLDKMSFPSVQFKKQQMISSRRGV